MITKVADTTPTVAFTRALLWRGERGGTTVQPVLCGPGPSAACGLIGPHHNAGPALGVSRACQGRVRGTSGACRGGGISARQENASWLAHTARGQRLQQILRGGGGLWSGTVKSTCEKWQEIAEKVQCHNPTSRSLKEHHLGTGGSECFCVSSNIVRRGRK